MLGNSLKQPKVSIDTTQNSSEVNSADDSSDSRSEIDGTTECDRDSKDDLTNANIDEREDDGYKLVHLQPFNQALGQAVLCAKCKSRTVSIFETKNARQGLASHLHVHYQCNSKHTVLYPKTQTTSNSTPAPTPPHSNYLGIFRRFRRAFAEVITFGRASAHEF